MKFKILRVLVLLISICAASCLVWNASRNEKLKKESKVDPDDMQFSSKSGPMMSPDDLKKLDGKGANDFKTPIEGNPAKSLESRDLMSSSKSIDAILTPSDLEGLRVGDFAKHRQSIDLIPSTKSPHRLIEPKDLEKMIEDKKQKSNNIEDVIQEEDPFSPTKKKDK
jgi:hypothetical protein